MDDNMVDPIKFQLSKTYLLIMLAIDIFKLSKGTKSLGYGQKQLSYTGYAVKANRKTVGNFK